MKIVESNKNLELSNKTLENDFAKLYESHKALRGIVTKQGESIKKLTEKAEKFKEVVLTALQEL